MSLVIIGNEEALGMIDREGIYSFFMDMCVESGGMTVHKGGEIDMRGCYTALAVCHVLGLDKFTIAQKSNIIHYIKSCQTYEGIFFLIKYLIIFKKKVVWEVNQETKHTAAIHSVAWQPCASWTN